MANEAAAATAANADAAAAATVAAAASTATTTTTTETAAAATTAATDTTTTTAAAADTKAAVPITYDLKLPETSKLDPAVLEKTTAIASESGLSPETAQKVLGLVDQVAGAHAEKAIADWQASQVRGGAAWETRNTEYKAAALKDPDLGNGDPAKLEQAASLGQRALAAFFPKEMIELITTAGLESHPGLLKGLVKIGRAMKEDDFVLTGGKPVVDKKRAADVLYGTKPAV